MLMAFGKLQSRTLGLRRKTVIGLKTLPQTITAAVNQYFQSFLLIVFNAYAYVCKASSCIIDNHNLFHNWWRDPKPYIVCGYAVPKDILAFIIMGVLGSLIVLYLYSSMQTAYCNHMANIRDMLAYYQRNRDEWEVVAINDEAINKFEITADELNELMEFTGKRAKLSKEEKLERQKEWRIVRARIARLLERKLGQIYDSDSSDSSIVGEDLDPKEETAECPRRPKVLPLAD